VRNRILLIDDERDTLTVFARLLRRLNCDIDTVDDLHDAEQAIDDHDYRVIITDLRLTPATGEEGLEVLRHARDKNATTDVIIVTGYGSPAVMTRAFDLGAAYYFEKPVQPAQLMEAVEELCR